MANLVSAAESFFVEKAIEQCRAGKVDVFKDAWQDPEAIEYYAQLPADELTKFFASNISNLTSIDDRVLMVGGGVGRIGRHISTLSDSQVTGLDKSDQMSSKARIIAMEQKLANYHPVTADAMHLPFEDNTFEIVGSYGMLRFIEDREKRIAALNEMLRVSDGLVILGEAGSCGRYIINLDHRQRKLQSARVHMPRISLGLHLLKLYETDPDFRKLVDLHPQKLPYIIGLAGTKLERLYYSVIIK